MGGQEGRMRGHSEEFDERFFKKNGRVGGWYGKGMEGKRNKSTKMKDVYDREKM